LQRNATASQRNATASQRNAPALLKNATTSQRNAPVSQRNEATLENIVQNGQSKTILEQKDAILDQSEVLSQKTSNETLQNKITDTVKHADTTLKSKPVIAKPKKDNKSVLWSLAISGGANYISGNNIWGQSTSAGAYFSGATSFPTTSVSNPPSNILNLPKTGYHFAAGVNIEKQLNRKILLQSGLIYRYLENKTTFNNSSLVNLLSANTTEYKNSLHLAELPVNIKYCFNPDSKTKLSLLAGGNIAVAVKKNWLFINSDLNQYEEKPSGINTVFFGLQTGASINFNNRFSLSLIARKNITSVQNTSSKYYLQQLDFQLNIPLKSFKK
jgi:vacuolar-type H+-ATPase subunit E/Vma4